MYNPLVLTKYAAPLNDIDLAGSRGRVLELLRMGQAGTRAELATLTGLSRGAISFIVADLTQAGFLRMEPGDAAGRGRPSERLYLNPQDPAMLIERLGLESARRTTYRRLSGGQQQRLSLAMAVVGRPELVFLDEPTSGLDPQARRATWELVRELRADGVTVVLSTHLMDEAEELADEVAIIDHGRVVAAGSPGELTRAGEEGSVRFDGPPRLDLESMRRALPPGSEATEVSPGSYAIRGHAGPRLLAVVTAWCAEQDVMPRALRAEGRSLEDVFLELTGHEMRQ